MKQSENISLKRLLKKTKDFHSSELDKIIGFYKTVLNIEHVKDNGENPSRVISDVAVSEKYGLDYIFAYCYKSLRREMLIKL